MSDEDIDEAIAGPDYFRIGVLLEELRALRAWKARMHKRIEEIEIFSVRSDSAYLLHGDGYDAGFFDARHAAAELVGEKTT